MTPEQETKLVIGNCLAEAIKQNRLYEVAAMLSHDLQDTDRSIYDICEKVIHADR